MAGNPAETDATAFTIWNAEPSWTFNLCVLAVSNQVSPLLEDVNPAGELFGAVLPIWTGPTLIRPVLGEATLSAKIIRDSYYYYLVQVHLLLIL